MNAATLSLFVVGFIIAGLGLTVWCPELTVISVPLMAAAICMGGSDPWGGLWFVLAGFGIPVVLRVRRYERQAHMLFTRNHPELVCACWACKPGR